MDTPLHVEQHVKPNWRAFYKSPLIKKFGDLQSKILHGADAVNSFICVLNSDEGCRFCTQTEIVFHAFMQCIRLKPLFSILQKFCLFSMKISQWRHLSLVLNTGTHLKKGISVNYCISSLCGCLHMLAGKTRWSIF